jgi:hypothetical protein
MHACIFDATNGVGKMQPTELENAVPTELETILMQSTKLKKAFPVGSTCFNFFGKEVRYLLSFQKKLKQKLTGRFSYFANLSYKGKKLIDLKESEC